VPDYIIIIIIIIIITYILTYLLQLSFHSVVVIFTSVQTKQIRIHKWYNTKNSTNNTKHNKHKYKYYQNTHTLQNKLKQAQYKIHT
jgi:uncharacterized ion transporter superfamily protein YfcC